MRKQSFQQKRIVFFIGYTFRKYTFKKGIAKLTVLLAILLVIHLAILLDTPFSKVYLATPFDIDLATPFSKVYLATPFLKVYLAIDLAIPFLKVYFLKVYKVYNGSKHIINNRSSKHV